MNETIIFDANAKGTRFAGIEGINIEDDLLFIPTWDSLNRRLCLNEDEVPLLFFAMTDGRLPSSLENILSNVFTIDNPIEDFTEVAELLILTLRKFSYNMCFSFILNKPSLNIVRICLLQFLFYF